MKAADIGSIVFWIALGGLGVWAYQAGGQAKPTKVSAATAKSRLAVTKAVAFGPRTTLWSTPHGDVIELTVPAATVGGRLLEVRRCIVWRDPNTGASSMSCAEPALDLVPSDGPETTE